MTDIVERLRKASVPDWQEMDCNLVADAAVEIERLREVADECDKRACREKGHRHASEERMGAVLESFVQYRKSGVVQLTHLLAAAEAAVKEMNDD